MALASPLGENNAQHVVGVHERGIVAIRFRSEAVIEPAVQTKILEEYDRQVRIYQDLAMTIAALLQRMIQGSDVQLHSITQRCKSRASLAGKLGRPEKAYAQLCDITDIAAVRVTTYFEEDVDRVATIVEREFAVDEASSIDKRTLLNPDRFGYQSLHYVVSVTAERARLVEYASFDGIKFEIQVRSILQHAWAEIEHDLGYKSAAGVPKEIRRRFSRIAGLLELADDEFSAIRRDLSVYAATVGDNIQRQPEAVGIDKISLRSVISTQGSALRSLSTAIARAAGAALEPSIDESLGGDVENLGRLGITTVAELEASARENGAIAERFAVRWLDGAQYSELPESIGVLYLAYVLLGRTGDASRVVAFLEAARVGPSAEREQIATRIIDIFRSVSG